MFMDEKKKQGGGLGIMGPTGEVGDDFADTDLYEMIFKELRECIESRDDKGGAAALEALVSCIQEMDEAQDAPG